MKHETAQSLGPLVHSRQHYQALLDYSRDRTEELYVQLRTADLNAVLGIQGQLKELKKLQSLKEAAKGEIENAKRD